MLFHGLPPLRVIGKVSPTVLGRVTSRCRRNGLRHVPCILSTPVLRYSKRHSSSNSGRKRQYVSNYGLIPLAVGGLGLGYYLYDSDLLVPSWTWTDQVWRSLPDLDFTPVVSAAEKEKNGDDGKTNGKDKDCCFQIKCPPPCGITTCESCKKKPKCDPCPPPKPPCAPPCDPCAGLKGQVRRPEEDGSSGGFFSWVSSLVGGGSSSTNDGCCVEETKKPPAQSCLCDNKDKLPFGKKKACPPPLPASPPCPCISDCFGDLVVTDVDAIREKCYQELCEALRELEAEKEAARKVIEKADAQFEQRKDKCCQVMDDVVQRANKLRSDACAKIKEVEEKAIALREEAKRRVREAQVQECEERKKMEARKLQLMNEALEFKVNLAEKCMRDALDMAVSSEIALANIVKCYVKALEDAVRSIQDPCDLENDPFAAVSELLEARQCLVEETMMKSGLFREAADTFRKIIEDGRMCPEVCSNPILEGAERKIRCMIDELDEASNQTRLVLCEVQGLKTLKGVLKDSWRYILPMLQTIVPDADPCDPCVPITLEQMNVMVIYLMQKYLRAALELEECKAQMPPTCEDKAPPLDCEALLYGSKACQPECRTELDALVQKRILEMLRSCCPVDPCAQPEPCL